MSTVLVFRGAMHVVVGEDCKNKRLRFEKTSQVGQGQAETQEPDLVDEIYNHERPHRALQGQTPGSQYQPSPRPYPERLPPVEYPAHFEVRKVCGNSCIKWHKRFVHVSRVLIGEWIGLDEVADGIWSVYLGPVVLAKFDEREQQIFD